MIRRCKPALGTFVEISIREDHATAIDAIDAAYAAIDRVERLMSFHDPSSDLAAINRDAARRPVRVDPWTFEVLEAAADLFHRTAGRFDCSVAPVLIDRGLLPAVATRPADRNGRFSHVVLDARECSVAYRAPLVVDLGGIAKGFAVDRAIEALDARGVTGAVVNAGGDLRVLGPFQVPIHVRLKNGVAVRVGDLADGAFASSGGKRDSAHAPGALVDAHSRRCVDGDTVYSVIAPTCLVADALTKVLATAGPDAGALLRTFDATPLVH